MDLADQHGRKGGRPSAAAIPSRPRRSRDTGYKLLHPRKAGLKDLRGLLEERGLTLDPSRAPLRSSVDALHLLYYHAAVGSLDKASAAVRERNQALYEEALSLARILCKYLPEGDPEKMLACSLARGAARASLDSWL